MSFRRFINSFRVLLGLWVLFLVSESTAQKRILILSWNVESGGNDAATIEEQLRTFEGYDIVGLCEVRADNAARYADAVEDGEGAFNRVGKFDYRLGQSGRADRMMVAWDVRRFDLVGEPVELDSINDGNHRSPFLVKLRLRDHDETFLFMVNHLARGNASLRQQQATRLNNWVRTQSIPVIAVGDYNFDYNIDDGKGNQAMENMLSPGLFAWVKPSELYKTNANPKYNGILDFVFLANKPDHWEINSKILVDGEGFSFPDDDMKSDHRPVQARIFIHDP